MSNDLVIITYMVFITSGLITLLLFMKKMLRENMELCRTLVKDQKLLAEKAFIQLKAQSVDQAVAASEAEIRYRLERDAAHDELAVHTRKAAEEYKASGGASEGPTVFTDIEGNEYTREQLDVGWR